MSGRFFTFQLSGYESYLAENIATSVQIRQLQNNSKVADGLRVVCAGGVGKSAHKAVVVDRLLLVLLHPYYRDILEIKDSSTIILPDVSLDQLSADFFGVLTGLCGDGADSQEDHDELNMKSELLEIDCDVGDNIEDDDYGVGVDEEDMSKDIKDKLDSQSLFISFEHSSEEFNRTKEEKSVLEEKEGISLDFKSRRRGQSICPKCYKKYNNRSIPYRCECDHILGGKFVSHEERPRMRKCPECDYQVGQRNAQSAIKKHFDAIHANVTYSCDFCDYKSGYKQVLKKHVDSLHKGAKYSCKECDYKNKFESGLFQHVQAVHRGVRYVCQFCGHQAIQTTALRKHEKAKHKEELEKLGNIKKSRSRFQVYKNLSLP